MKDIRYEEINLSRKAPTHSIGISVLTSTEEQWSEAHSRFMTWLQMWSNVMPHVSVHSSLLDGEDGVEEEGEYYDENTLVKVKEALDGVLRSFGFTNTELPQAMINEMLNAGILFRERR